MRNSIVNFSNEIYFWPKFRLILDPRCVTTPKCNIKRIYCITYTVVISWRDLIAMHISMMATPKWNLDKPIYNRGLILLKRENVCAWIFWLSIKIYFRSVISSSVATIEDIDNSVPYDGYDSNGLTGLAGFPALLPVERIKLKDEIIAEKTTLKLPEKRKAVTLGRAHTAPFLKKAQQILGQNTHVTRVTWHIFFSGG